MKETKHPEEITSGELEEYLSELGADLKDLEEERLFVLSQTGLHVSAGAVKKYESQLETLREHIAEAERLVLAKKAE